MLSPDCLCRKVASKGDGKQELVDGTGPVNQNKGASWNFQISFYTPYHIMSKYSSSICELNCVFPRRHKANELSSFPFRFHFTCPITSCLNISIRAGTYIQIKMRRHKANESLRPGKPRSHADIFGIEGSFRRLDLHSYYYHLHQLHDKPANINNLEIWPLFISRLDIDWLSAHIRNQFGQLTAIDGFILNRNTQKMFKEISRSSFLIRQSPDEWSKKVKVSSFVKLWHIFNSILMTLTLSSWNSKYRNL